MSKNLLAATDTIYVSLFFLGNFIWNNLCIEVVTVRIQCFSTIVDADGIILSDWALISEANLIYMRNYISNT